MRRTQEEFYPEQWPIYQRIWQIGGVRHQLKEQHVLAQGAGVNDKQLDMMGDQIQAYYSESRRLWRQILELEPWFPRALELARIECGFRDDPEWYRNAIEWQSHTEIWFRIADGAESKNFVIRHDPTLVSSDDLTVESLPPSAYLK